MNSTILLLATLLGTAGQHQTPVASKDKVEITVKAEKPADGKRVVFLTLDIAEGWHMLSNPVGNDELEFEQTKVAFLSRGTPVAAKIEYPAPTRKKKDRFIGDYGIYEGTIAIKAIVPHADDLEAILRVQTFTEKVCILPSRVKIKIE